MRKDVLVCIKIRITVCSISKTQLRCLNIFLGSRCIVQQKQRSCYIPKKLKRTVNVCVALHNICVIAKWRDIIWILQHSRWSMKIIVLMFVWRRFNSGSWVNNLEECWEESYKHNNLKNRISFLSYNLRKNLHKN